MTNGMQKPHCSIFSDRTEIYKGIIYKNGGGAGKYFKTGTTSLLLFEINQKLGSIDLIMSNGLQKPNYSISSGQSEIY
jgi:hypothetical protein